MAVAAVPTTATLPDLLIRLLTPPSDGNPVTLTQAELEQIKQMSSGITPDAISLTKRQQIMAAAAACLCARQVGRVQRLFEASANIWPEEKRAWPFCAAEAAVMAIGSSCENEQYGLALALITILHCYEEQRETIRVQMQAKGQILERLITKCLVAP